VTLIALAVLLALQVAPSDSPQRCREEDLAAMLRAEEQVARGDDAAARASLMADTAACTPRRIASLALRGWLEARALSPAGGAVNLQGPVRHTLEALVATAAADSPWALDVEYAEVSIRAAIAAAQDERPEMELLLTHARDVSERLLARGRRAVWPRPFNVTAGELWFEVDRYADAVAAYDRAVRADASALARVGLARSLARLERVDEACAIYRRIEDAAPLLRAAATPDLARCR
jgi:tetratricopeptide (TPR) repeat protein